MRRRIGPVVVLVVLALLIREGARTRGRSTWWLLVLGIALAIAVECPIVQTSLAPGPDVTGFGRALGVNWPYLVWAVGYESVWSVLIPIQLTEMIFPAQADEPWLSPPGRRVGLLVLAGGAVLAWWSWTRVVRPRYLDLPVYRPPVITLLAAGTSPVIAVLVSLAVAVLAVFGLVLLALRRHQGARVPVEKGDAWS